MCGISGIITNESKDSLELSIHRMINNLKHRGPDSFGIWTNKNLGVALGHRRLSILDTSNSGSQPMISKCGRYIVTFNGEIYNHLDIRKEIGSSWIGRSDTETMLEAFSIWGVEKTLLKVVGMFAIGIWDSRDNCMYLVRDRFGEKPLYYGWVGKAFLFSSELKSMKVFPGFNNQICSLALSEYLRYGYIPAPLSIYKNIYKLQPGSLIKISFPFSFDIPNGPFEPSFSFKNFELKKWWSFLKLINSSHEFTIKNENEAKIELEKRLIDAIKEQTLSDVPIGAFLSGGIDSSTIVALMQLNSAENINTFTIGFEEFGFNEGPFASRIAKHLGTNHNEFMVTSKDALKVIPFLPNIYDEPFGDSSQIPTHIVSQVAKNKVSVVLSGDGGDEIFGGYNRYFWAPNIWNKLSWIPYPLRAKLGFTLQFIPFDKYRFIENFLGVSQLGEKVRKLSDRLKNVNNLDSLYWSLVTEISNPESYLLPTNLNLNNSYLQSTLRSDNIERVLSQEELMMYYDTISYLPDDILCKVDRASMSCSLETRSPYLDHRVVDYAWKLPISMKIKGNESKWILKEILKKYVPKYLTDRPKAGFAVPVGHWLRFALKDWAEDLLNETRLKQDGIFNVNLVSKLWIEHKNLQQDHSSKLWIILMFQAWYKENF